MKLQQLLSYTRKAVDDYQMIEEGDKIAVGGFRWKRQSDTALCTKRAAEIFTEAF